MKNNNIKSIVMCFRVDKQFKNDLIEFKEFNNIKSFSKFIRNAIKNEMERRGYHGR